jgi:preprotein translocase subunit SecF
VLSVALLIFRGLNFGVDFTGGTLVGMGFPQSVETVYVAQRLDKAKIAYSTIQHFGSEHDRLVRIPPKAQIDKIRIPENFRRMRKTAPRHVINASVNQTMSRSVITSDTALMVVIAMFIFGGPLLHGFSLALIIGILVGTYPTRRSTSPARLPSIGG